MPLFSLSAVDKSTSNLRFLLINNYYFIIKNSFILKNSIIREKSTNIHHIDAT